MACGAYSSMVVLGDASKSFKKDALIDRLVKRSDNSWNVVYAETKENYDTFFDNTLNDYNFNPSDEGRIDNPKSMKKTLQKN